MVLSALVSDQRLILYLDFKSPYAYLAKDPALQLEKQFGIEIDWRPLTLNIPSFLGSAKVNERKEVIEENRSEDQWRAVRYAYYDVKRYARQRDILIYGPRKIWDTNLAHIAWLYAKSQGRDVMMRFINLVYERFWRRKFNVEDLGEVTHALSVSGCCVDDFEEFATGEGKSQLCELQRRVNEDGIFGVPTFVIDSEVFFGREHLPMIEWILEGKRGLAPDIAY